MRPSSLVLPTSHRAFTEDELVRGEHGAREHSSLPHRGREHAWATGTGAEPMAPCSPGHAWGSHNQTHSCELSMAEVRPRRVFPAPPAFCCGRSWSLGSEQQQAASARLQDPRRLRGWPWSAVRQRARPAAELGANSCGRGGFSGRPAFRRVYKGDIEVLRED